MKVVKDLFEKFIRRLLGHDGCFSLTHKSPPDDLEQKVSLGLMPTSQRSNAIATSIFLI
jgi:hypothetical protein